MSYVLVVFELLFFYSLILSNICFILSWFFFFFVKQKTAYDMRIRYWSSDVCSSDLQSGRRDTARGRDVRDHAELRINFGLAAVNREIAPHPRMRLGAAAVEIGDCANARSALGGARSRSERSGIEPVESGGLDAFGARGPDRFTGKCAPERQQFGSVERRGDARGRGRLGEEQRGIGELAPDEGPDVWRRDHIGLEVAEQPKKLPKAHGLGRKSVVEGKEV